MKLIHLSELVHGVGLDIKEVNEDGEEIEIPACPTTGEPTNTCECEDCVAERGGGNAGVRVRVKREGVVDMVTIDLLDDNYTLWLETPAGVPFIHLQRDGENVFVFPRDGRRSSGQWAVASINSRTTVGGWAETDIHGEEGACPLPTALKKAQEWALASGFQLPSRYAGWRNKNLAPSDLQMQLAKRLEIPHFSDMTKGRISDEISIAFVSARVDHAIVQGVAE